ncbi:MAG: hypothetical protein A3B23_01495 [Candidatus Colwellbacteria bacterium RIFCSPLOWO2_01_FULL_48_10]|uniref:Serine hydroxymethyltransferase n=1 Tax=Candidatus Colwellbacteria bacterium RIFCSPLOWO2_01_FULL_48_10 TaxID=1797690 RepID=A0A1G1Z3H8_9BACT|nr:MAG: hypothetical protein A3B23_01495 [Candidatus Colwellbacteria bacterium RIFCSPLOWO2_01_FULL_48_10]
MKDAVIKGLIQKEIKRQNETLGMIPSENFTSLDVMEAVGSPLTNKYSEGYPGKRYYPGNEFCDAIENLAIKRGLKVFGLDPNEWGLNVQPHSGSPANIEIYNALIEPGDTILGMKLAAGGHLTHGHKISITGRVWNSVQYGVDKNGLIDFQEVLKLAQEHKPKIIISGFSAYPRLVDWKRFNEIAKLVGAYHMVDMSHTAGLIAGKAHPSPFPYADVVMTTTHKTMRGPRGAIIFARKNKSVTKTVNGKEITNTLAELIDKSVFPGAQGGPHNNVTAGIAVMFYEAMTPAFKKYAAQVVKNCGTLAFCLKELGFQLVSGGTDSHLLLADVRPLGVDGMTAQNLLESVGIIANRNSVPGDPSPFKPSGVRFGTPSLTTRGMKEKEMKLIARFIYGAVKGEKGVKEKVLKLCKKFPATKFLKK